MSNRFSIYPATLNGSINLQQLESYGFSPNATKAPIIPGGALDRAHIGLANAMPVHRFGTRDLVTYFANVSATLGLAITAAVFRYQQRKCNEGFDSTAVHVGRSVAGGFLKPGTLSANAGDQQGAVISSELYSASTDGLTDPDTKDASQDFSAVAVPTFISRFFFGPVYLGATKLQGIEGISIDFGLNCEGKLFDGTFPTCHTINTRTPSVTFTGSNAAIDAALSSFANDLTAPFASYLRKGVHGQSRVADNVGNHFKCSFSSGEWSVDDENVASNEDGSFSFTATPTGTMTIATNSTIP